MAVMLKTTTTKPSNTVFYGDQDPQLLDEFREWQHHHALVLGRHRNQVNENTWEHVFIFENQENLSTFKTEKDASHWHQTLVKYQTDNNQTVTEEIIVI
jgi:hypothetical protein